MTQRFAFKCSYITVGNERKLGRLQTIDGGKRSEGGLLKLVIGDDGVLTTVPAADPREDQLKSVFRNGQILLDQSFADIRGRAV